MVQLQSLSQVWGSTPTYFRNYYLTVLVRSFLSSYILFLSQCGSLNLNVASQHQMFKEIHICLFGLVTKWHHLFVRVCLWYFFVLTAQLKLSLPARLSKLLFLLLWRFSTIACYFVCKGSPAPNLWNCNALREAENSLQDPGTIIWYRQKPSILVS